MHVLIFGGELNLPARLLLNSYKANCKLVKEFDRLARGPSPHEHPMNQSGWETLPLKAPPLILILFLHIRFEIAYNVHLF